MLTVRDSASAGKTGGPAVVEFTVTGNAAVCCILGAHLTAGLDAFVALVVAGVEVITGPTLDTICRVVAREAAFDL